MSSMRCAKPTGSGRTRPSGTCWKRELDGVGDSNRQRRQSKLRRCGPWLTTGPLAAMTPVTGGLSRSLTDTPTRRSGRITGPDVQIPKLIVRVRFPSPAPRQNPGQLRCPESDPHLVRAIAENGRLRSLVLGVADGAGVGLYDLPHHHDPASPPEPEKCLCVIGLDAEFGCSSGEFELGADVEFRVSVAQVCFDGAFAEEQVPGDVRR